MPGEYYEQLGVSPDASESEITAAFRERIKETHPDVSDDDAASDRTKRLIEAKDVLTDPDERAKYDRLGHEAYLAQADTPTADATADREETPAERATTDTADTATGRTADSDRETAQSDSYDGTRRQRSTASHRVWETDRSYAVGNSPGMFSLRELVTSQRTVVLLGTTFAIYPVLLFGALFQSFPTAANLVVAVCLVLVVAFLQSIPQVGILVFGLWLVLLPVVVFWVVGVPLLSITGVLSFAAVVFPFGLSVLTYVAIRPERRRP